jgi:hypothetical protein
LLTRLSAIMQLFCIWRFGVVTNNRFSCNLRFAPDLRQVVEVLSKTVRCQVFCRLEPCIRCSGTAEDKPRVGSGDLSLVENSTLDDFIILVMYAIRRGRSVLIVLHQVSPVSP